MRAVTPITRHIGRAPVIVGGGIAGLMTALRLAPDPVVVLAKAALQTEASSAWAQGGMAAAVGPDDDPALHLADTLAAGDGLCDADVARRVTAAGPAAVQMLLQYGVRFDRDPAGTLRLGRERRTLDAASFMPPAMAPVRRSCGRLRLRFGRHLQLQYWKISRCVG
jgi:aspartate oxidase